MENIIEYDKKIGYYINSKRLSEKIGCKHNDLIRRIQRLHKGYINYTYETNPFVKGYQIKIYMLKPVHLENLRIDSNIKDGLRKIMQEKNEELKQQIRQAFSVLFDR